MRILWSLTACLMLAVSHGFAGETEPEGGWRSLPLVTDGQVDKNWAQIGWGGFGVEDGALRTDCDEKGMGLLLYRKEKLGNCQIRVVYRSQQAKSNSGVYIRIDDGVLDHVGEKSPPVQRDAAGKLSKEMHNKLMDASERQLGAWYPVHHGYEVQICDSADEYHRTGAIYSLAKAAELPKADSTWRTMVITLDGTRVLVDLDGKRISTFDSESPPPARKNWTEPVREVKRPTAGYLGLQNHDPGDVVYFREISVRPLSSAR